MFLKIFIRKIRRQFSFFLIEITGLSLAFTFGFLVFLFAKSELGYDRFHRDAGSIYCVNTFIGFRGGMVSEGTPFLLAKTLEETVPEITSASHMVNRQNLELESGSVRVTEDVHLVATNFIELFNFPMEKGDGKNALEDPNSIIISEQLAVRIFGKEDPIQKNITVHLSETQQKVFQVGAVSADVPENSSITFDVLISDQNANLFLGERSVANWIPFKSNVVTFIKAAKNAERSALVTGLNQIAESHGIPERLNSTDQKEKFPLMRLVDVHFQNKADITFLKEKGNKNYLYVLLTVAFLILMVAAINFTNLTLGLAIIRGKETGIRKVLGSSRQSIRHQFILESLITVFTSLTISILLSVMSLSRFNQLLDKDLSVSISEIPTLLAFILITGIATALIAGAYPAFALSSQRASNALKGKISLQYKWLPNSMTSFQFGISMLLIIVALIMRSQLIFISNYDPGFNKAHLIYQTFDYSLSPSDQEVERFATEALKSTHVLGVSGTRGGLMDNEAETLWSIERKGEPLTVPSVKIGYDFIPLMQISLLEGRNFSPASPSDSEGIIVNQAFIDQLEIDNPVGNTINLGGVSPVIIGVVENFRFNSLRNPIRPLILNLRPGSPNTAILIRIDGNHTREALEFLKQTWEVTSGNTIPFEYQFFDAELERQYAEEKRFRSVIAYASFFALLTALIGTVGLTQLNITRRLKEISLRRIVGCELTDILILFMKETGRLLVIASFIFWPVSFLYLESWLNQYNARTSQNPLIYVGIGLLILTIAAFLTFLQIRKTSRENPANVLRSE
ncbi:MAG: FtsX-like permease family protein [Cyclobacteriaceae bacterium]